MSESEDDDLPEISVNVSGNGPGSFTMPPASQLASQRSRELGTYRALRSLAEGGEGGAGAAGGAGGAGAAWGAGRSDSSGSEAEAALAGTLSSLQMAGEAEGRRGAGRGAGGPRDLLNHAEKLFGSYREPGAGGAGPDGAARWAAAACGALARLPAPAPRRAPRARAALARAQRALRRALRGRDAAGCCALARAVAELEGLDRRRLAEAAGAAGGAGGTFAAELLRAELATLVPGSTEAEVSAAWARLAARARHRALTAAARLAGSAAGAAGAEDGRARWVLAAARGTRGAQHADPAALKVLVTLSKLQLLLRTER